MIFLSIAGYVSLTSENDIGQKKVKRGEKRSSVGSSTRDLIFWPIYLFDSTEYHNLYHLQLKDYERSPEVT